MAAVAKTSPQGMYTTKVNCPGCASTLWVNPEVTRKHGGNECPNCRRRF